MAKVLELGMTVARPFGDSAKFDFLVEAGGKISRVQVKSAWVRSGTGYQIVAGPCCDQTFGMRRSYALNEIDFIVAYIAPEDVWFVFPIKAVRSNYLLVKTAADWRLAKYREGWGALRGAEC